jgi:hypothetical protein
MKTKQGYLSQLSIIIVIIKWTLYIYNKKNIN